MYQCNLSDIIELENRFRAFADTGVPYLIDHGLFIDAVLDVTDKLKNQLTPNHPDFNEEASRESFQVVMNLYHSLQDFEQLYRSSMKK